MAILDCSKLSEEELAALPCACCGGPLGSVPGSGSDWICWYCIWQDDAVQFKYPWVYGGANRYSLWQSRRNYLFSAQCDGLDSVEQWKHSKPPPKTQYSWDLDPSFFADYAGGFQSDCPILFARDALRAAGLFSYRQMRQKFVAKGMGYPEKDEVEIGHARVVLSKDRSSILQVEIRNLSNDSTHEHIRRVSGLKKTDLENFEVSLNGEFTGGPGQQCILGELNEDHDWDPNAYWVRMSFNGDKLERILFTASESGSSPFEDLDKDWEN